MRKLIGRQLEITDDPYRIVINGRPEYRSTAPGNIVNGYRVTVQITRIDEGNVVANFRNYTIPEGGIYLNLDSALGDGERIARQAIADGFPDR
ncbi:hypothetical protein R69746_05802 [Paraburkholderia aspalathi]|uniref:hypothetical protein n=1 Tax=Paraburkholderia aspalathi TaxID=1324617 RepID=UPI0019093AEA|nr:hypothetical protein [Paraburkholderia aspalathi]MBK3841842.1 hypothetical protein [Paraburkholderia aspalathi]CAE6815161.1 hypothetical protein R69746_05802 [Paraburkholderia aspalathi]